MEVVEVLCAVCWPLAAACSAPQRLTTSCWMCARPPVACWDTPSAPLTTARSQVNTTGVRLCTELSTWNALTQHATIVTPKVCRLIVFAGAAATDWTRERRL